MLEDESFAISERITELRKQHQMSQEQLAESLHVTRQAVSNWERNKSMPDLTLLQKMTVLFGITMDELIRGGYKKMMTPHQATDSNNEGERYRQMIQFQLDNKYDISIGLFYAASLFLTLALFLVITFLIRSELSGNYWLIGGLLAVWLCSFLGLGLLAHVLVTLFRKDK